MVPVPLLQLIAAAAASAALPAHAHHADASVPLWAAWNLEPWLVALMLASALLYARGARVLWKRAGIGRGVTAAEAARFALGWLALAAALVAPIDALGERSFAFHMIQHELLMVVAAPLLVCSRPLEAFTWALAPEWRRAFGRFAHQPVPGHAWALFTEPVGAWTVHAVALWAWHVPAFFGAALHSEPVHIAQHASFFVSALLFWWSVLARRSRRAEGAAVASLFTTMMHTSALGALLTFAPTVWYRDYLAAAAVGLSPLEDQQLGGLVMWVPAGMAYIVTGLVIVAGWLRDVPRPAPLR